MVAPKEYKNIVVVGTGSTGAGIINNIIASKKIPANYRFIAISEKSYSYYPVGALRASIVPGWEDKVTAPLDNWLKAPHTVLISKVTSIDDVGRKVILEENTQLGSEIPYEILVLATGSIYPLPARPPPEASTISEVTAALRKFQGDVGDSSSILIIGGGPVGIEFAGEVHEHYGQKKKITLVHAGYHLLDRSGFKPDGVPARALKLFDHPNLKVLLGQKVETTSLKTGKLPGLQRFTTSKGEVIEADFVLVATGNTPNVDLARSIAPDSINLKNGRVKFRPNMRIDSSNSNLSNVFVAGDMSDSTGTMLAGMTQIPIIVNEILALTGVKAKPLAYKEPSPAMLVTFGSKVGAGYFMFNMPNFLISMLKGKSLFIPKFKETYNAKV